MKTTYFKRNLFLGVMILFVGAFVVSSQGENIANAIVPEIEWTEHIICDSAREPKAVFAADIDGDEDNDVVSVNSEWGIFSEVAWYENLGGYPPSWTEHIIITLPSGCCLSDLFAIDLDNDNDIDIVSAGFAAGPCGYELVWYENLGGSPPSWDTHVIPQSKGMRLELKQVGGPSVFAKDINGDDYVDILWGGASYYIAWYKNSGGSPPTWDEYIITDSLFLAGGASVFAIDIDNDVDVDVLVGVVGTGELYWYENDGSYIPSWTDHFVYDHPGENIGDIFAIDIENDSDIDILCAGSHGGDWFENDGGLPPSWTKRRIDTNWTHSIFGVDIDNDNDIDVVGGVGESCMFWYENDGSSPPSWTAFCVGAPPRAQVLFPIDLDGDHDTDIVAGYIYINSITWFENPYYTITITNISDVGNDQGKQVRIDWSSFPGNDPLVTHSTIFRRIDSLLFALLRVKPEIFSSKDYPPGRWEMVGTYPAYGETLYSATVPTLKDSTMAEGMYWSVFFIRAGTENPIIYFDSPVDSGYSLDNIPPLPIGDFDIDPNSWFTLEWTVPGEYVGEQPISTYDIRYSTVPVGADTQAWWDDAEACSGDGFFNLTVGEEDSFQVAKETWCHPECYFAIKGLDSRPNASKISNIIHFMCGDATGDGVVDLGDIVYEINYVFRNGPPPVPRAVGDVNCDGIEDLGDIVYKINYVFRGGPPPCSP